MKTIEERAREFAISISPYPQDRGETFDTDTERAYIKGATEQKAIDIEKACEWLKDSIFFGEDGICIGSYTDTTESILNDFREAMEE